MARKFSEYVLLERCKLDQKYFFVYDKYTPNYKKTAVTAKFYSKYETEEDFDPSIVHKLKRAKDFTPRQKREWPETVNQDYGWFNEPFVRLDREDLRLYFPKVTTETTKHGLKMLQVRKKR